MNAPSATEIARRLITAPTVNPPGDEVLVRHYLESVLSSAGIEVEVLERVPDRPNLVARLPGTGDRPPLILHGHVDVVGVTGQQWRHPPFSGVHSDGVLWGRGALDMKAGVAMMVDAVARHGDAGFRPSGDVLLLIVADSESGGSDGLGYLLEDHSGLVDGAEYAIGEFGAFPMRLMGRRFYPIGVSMKQYAHLRVTMRGPGGHGSGSGSGVAASLGNFLRGLDGEPLGHRRHALSEEIIETMAAALPPTQASSLRRLLDAEEFGDALSDLGEAGHHLSMLFRDTINATIIRAGHKFNVVPSEATVELDTRLLPGSDVDAVVARVERIAGEDASVEVLATGPPAADNYERGLFETLAGILTELDREALPIPYLFSESPDGRLLAAHGIQHYGWLPMDLPPTIDLPRLIHGPDERVPLHAIEFGAEAMHRLIERY